MRLLGILGACWLLIFHAAGNAENTINFYQVTVLGENYLINMNGQTRKLGFVTDKFVEAQSLQEAERLAVRLVKLELRGKILNQADDPPKLLVEDSARIEKLANGPQGNQLGLVWFPMQL